MTPIGSAQDKLRQAQDERAAAEAERAAAMDYLRGKKRAVVALADTGNLDRDTADHFARLLDETVVELGWGAHRPEGAQPGAQKSGDAA